MTKHRQVGFLALGLIVLMVSGCATRPIAKEYRQKAAAADITFSMVLRDPAAYVGDVVLWGGVIIATKNLKNGTNIKVLETPLHGSERPMGRAYSRGRFIAHSSKLLDPEVYRKGRKITVAGVVSRKEVQPLGETTYTYPVVSVKQLVLWQPRSRYAYPDYYWWGPYWGAYWGPYWGPYRGPYWGWGPGFVYYGDNDKDFDNGGEREEHERFGGEEREEHEHFGGEKGGGHGESGGERR